MRDAERVEPATDLAYDGVDLGVGPDAGPVDRPSGKDVSEAVECSGRAQELDDTRIDFGRRRGGAFERVPERRAVAFDDNGSLAERPLDAAHEVEDVVHALGLWLRVPNECGPQAPVVRARAFGEVDHAGELGRLDRRGHPAQATAAARVGIAVSSGIRGCEPYLRLDRSALWRKDGGMPLPDSPPVRMPATRRAGLRARPAGAGRERARPRGTVSTLFSFPDPVNEVSARLVAGGVAVLSVLTIALDQPWLLVPLAYGFVARVSTGPTLSPLGQFVTRAVTPRLRVPPKYVPGPPKRFAQGIGATLSVAAVVLHFGFGATGAAYVLVGAIAFAATLESVFAFCVGCKIFALLMRAGVIPESVCERCNDIWSTGATK